MAMHQINPQGAKLAALDPIWDRVRSEAEDIVRREPELASFIYSTVLHHDRLEDSVVHRIAERLDHSALSGDLIRQTYDEALRDDPDLGNAFRADLVAVYDRDPATSRFIDPLALLQGLPCACRPIVWRTGSIKKAARILPIICRAARRRCSRPTSIPRPGSAAASSSITPPALSCGETAVIEDDVSILHGVTLGGTGKENEDRHPKIRHGVLIGAGAKILGNIEVGHCARIAAGSVVVKPVPHNVTVAGVPAKIVGEAGCAEPSRTMDQMINAIGL